MNNIHGFFVTCRNKLPKNPKLVHKKTFFWFSIYSFNERKNECIIFGECFTRKFGLNFFLIIWNFFVLCERNEHYVIFFREMIFGF